MKYQSPGWIAYWRNILCRFLRLKYETKYKLVYVYLLIKSDREKKEGLPVASYMDRDKVTKSNSQVGFIKYVLLPMFETMGKVDIFSEFNNN